MVRISRWIVVALVLVPAWRSNAQGIARGPHPRNAIVFQTQANTAATAIVYSALVNPSNVVVQKVTIYQSSAGGGGAGSTVVRISDGTNNCDATYLCTATAGTNATLTVTPTGACTFSAGATITIGFSASTCTTTQPGIRSIVATGVVRD